MIAARINLGTQAGHPVVGHYRRAPLGVGTLTIRLGSYRSARITSHDLTPGGDRPLDRDRCRDYWRGLALEWRAVEYFDNEAKP